MRVFGDLPRVFGNYIVVSELATGGMAKVYRAKPIDARFKNLVAVKRLRASAIGDARFTQMFIDEARLAAQLAHPNIVHTYELGRDDVCLFSVMEHVWGETTSALIGAARTDGVRIPVPLACAIVLRAAEGLDFAHRARSLTGAPLNLVHRDVSPQNVLVSYEGEVKIIDFGIAKSAFGSHRTEPGMIKGKPRYMAPEQVTGSSVDARTDIFGLGLVLYEMLKGTHAFDGSNPMIIFEQILHEEPKALSEELPSELRAIVSQCLAKEPVRRFQTMAALMESLTPFAMDDGKIVGRRHLQELMTRLFPEARERVRTLSQRYAAITVEQCVNAKQPPPVDRNAVTVLINGAPVTAPIPDVSRTVIAAAVPEPDPVIPKPSAKPAMIFGAVVSLLFWIWMVARIALHVDAP